MIINAHDANIKLIDLIAAVKNGEEVFIVDEDGKTFQIVQVEQFKKRRKAGSAEGLIEMADDFDAPLEDFKEYMPTEQSKPQHRKFGTAKGQFKMSDDFDAPIDDFDEYK